MYENIINFEQIITIIIFLSLLLGGLFFLRRKSSFIKAKLNEGKRILLLEDNQISPTERIKLFLIDNEKFVILTSKGHPASIVHIKSKKSKNKTRKSGQINNDLEELNLEAKTSKQIKENDDTILLKKTFSDDKIADLESLQDFSQKFKSWRENKWDFNCLKECF